MVMENLQPFKNLKEFIRGKESLLTEDMAREIMRQAVMGEKECLYRGVFHQGLYLDTILFNPKNLKLHITDFSKGTFVDTADFDISKYSGERVSVCLVSCVHETLYSTSKMISISTLLRLLHLKKV